MDNLRYAPLWYRLVTTREGSRGEKIGVELFVGDEKGCEVQKKYGSAADRERWVGGIKGPVAGRGEKIRGWVEL